MRTFGTSAAVAVLMCAALSAPSFAQKRGGTLSFAMTAEPPTYDCHATTTFAVVQPIGPSYSLLLQYDAANYPKIIGDLAEGHII